MSTRNNRRNLSVVILIVALIALIVGAGVVFVVSRHAPEPTPSATPAVMDVDDDAAGAPSDAPVSLVPGATVGPTSARLPGEPDPALTPGALNPSVTQTDISSTICKSGWTATIRPSVTYTNNLKRQQIVQYGYSDTSMSDYEEDHLISLELGGNPTDPHNLWPEPYSATLSDGRPTGAHTKDAFETSLKKEVCAGTITLSKAQSEIGDYWVHFYYNIPMGAAAPTISISAPTSTAATIGGLSVSFTSVPKSVVAGGDASIAVKTSVGASCSIVVTYASGHQADAVGLGTQTAGSAGATSWTWRIGSSTTHGTTNVAVTCKSGGLSGGAQTQFSVA